MRQVNVSPPPFTQAQMAAIQREARPMLVASLRKGMVAGLLLGATLACILLWLAGLGTCP